ncbi:NAD(P)-binding protein [Gonapodya prolifera JEL478]|uniref:NAD(P)-binding protein n=1 Tax=Gonapodya prolifera (strain JEL478) TaxID=1344416 RepID=A0A139AFA9_GONPJ|nr:NAD(P)-binding protein [Gonapodya prolifera JEL478]|eukprot:KXS15501.1 NAD(P)-binding protein [Gonapodya prolifera JEL478]
MPSTSNASTFPRFPSKLAGKRVLVIGGTSGIGLAVASGALSYGASVVIASSSLTKVEAAVQRLRSTTQPLHAPRYRGILSRGPLDHIAYTSGDAFNPVPLSQLTPEDMVVPQVPTKSLFMGPIMGMAQEGLVNQLTIELAPLRVNLIIPGPVKTDLFLTFVDEAARKVYERTRRQRAGWRRRRMLPKHTCIA